MTEPTKKEIIESAKELAKKAKIKLKITPSLIRALASDSKTRNEAISMLAKYFTDNKSILTLIDTGEIFIYDKGVYIGNGDKILAKEAQSILDKHASNHFVNEVLGHVKRDTYTNRNEIEEPKDKICLENGIFNITSSEIEKHNPLFIFFNKLPVYYLATADCPLIKKFLSEVVARKEDIDIIQEFFGYCLFKDYIVHKAILLIGTGANGKSTLIKLLKAMLGDKNCASVPLQQLENDKFALSSLFGKLANIFADLPSRALKETSIFKMLTGEDQIPAEKKFKDQFFFTNYAKMIFSANQVPKSPDDSDAFFRRWIMITFPNQFENEKADKKLIQKLTTKEELSGLLNFAIEGLRRLLEQGDFSSTKSIEEVRENYIRQSDSVAAFILDAIEIKSNEYIPKKKLYTAYADYCRELSYPAVPENTFHRELQKKIRVEDYRPSLNNQRVQCWMGIALNMENNPDKVDIIDNGQASQGCQGKLPL